MKKDKIEKQELIELLEEIRIGKYIDVSYEFDKGWHNAFDTIFETLELKKK